MEILETVKDKVKHLQTRNNGFGKLKISSIVLTIFEEECILEISGYSSKKN